MHTQASDDRRSIASVELLRLTTTGPVRIVAPVEGEAFWINIQRQGGATLQQHGRVASLAAGDIAVCYSNHDYQLDMRNHGEQIVMVVPAAALRLACAGIDELTAVTRDRSQPLVKLLGLMAASHLETSGEALPLATALRAARALIDTAAGCMLAAQPAAASAGTRSSQYHLKRIRAYVLTHLDEPELTVAKVGAMLGLSAAHIHRLFAAETQTFSAWLWETRLLACRQALKVSGPTRQSITMVAQQHGFSHGSHFSRAFRARFGITASAWRNGTGG
jgi:AraC-like DNA-binding protein